MAKPIAAMVYWCDSLYGPNLQAFVDDTLDADPRLVALVRTVHNRKEFRRGIFMVYDQDGPSDLRHTDLGLRITKSQFSSPKSIPNDEHGYKGSVWISDDPGLAWRVFLHRAFALVLPGTAAKRKSHKTMSEDALFIMRRPQSAHDRVGLARTFSTLERDAAELLDYAWKDGIILRDPFKEFLTAEVHLRTNQVAA